MVSFNYARTERVWFDKALEADFQKLEAAAPDGAPPGDDALGSASLEMRTSVATTDKCAPTLPSLSTADESAAPTLPEVLLMHAARTPDAVCVESWSPRARKRAARRSSPNAAKTPRSAQEARACASRLRRRSD